MKQLSRALVAAFSVSTLTLPALLGAQAMPTAASVVARHVEAIGGKDAVMKISSVHQQGTMEMPGMGLSAEMSLYAAAPNKQSVNMVIPGIGEILQGYNGEYAWNADPMSGPRLADGAELGNRAESAIFLESFGIFDATDFTSMEIVEKSLFAGEEAYKVKFVRKSGSESYEFYSVASGLRVGSQSEAVSPMGTIQINATVSDYKDFGGVKLPTRLSQSQAGQDIVMTMRSITFNDVPADAFALPPAIQALVKP